MQSDPEKESRIGKPEIQHLQCLEHDTPLPYMVGRYLVRTEGVKENTKYRFVLPPYSI